MVLSKGHRLGHPFLDIRGRVSFGGERGLLSIAFPPDYVRSRRFYVYYTDQQGDIRVDEFKRRTPTRAAAGSRRTVIEDPPPRLRQPQRRPAPVPRQAPLFRDRRRRLRRRPAEQRAEQERPARQAAANRPQALGRQALLDPRRQPVRGPDRRARRDLQLRAAQPVPILVRHRHRRPAADRDRRRRPEPVRGARLHDRRGPRRAPTSAGTRSRATPSTGTKTAARRTRAGPSNRSSPTPTAATAAARSSAAYVVGDRRLGSARSGPTTSTPTSARAGCEPSSRICTGRAAIGSSARRSNRRARSAKTHRGGSMSPRSKDRSTGSWHGRLLARSASFNEGSPVESGTVETSSRHEQRAERCHGGRPERIEVHNPATGDLVGTIDVDSRRETSPRPSPACAATSPAWEALGNEGRYRWLGKSARLAARQPRSRSSTRSRRRPERSAATSRASFSYVAE